MRINIYGSPNAGKSKLMADIFSFLKGNHIKVEQIPEYVKKYAYAKTPIEGYMNLDAVVKHLKKEYELLSKKAVKAIVTDSPVLLGLFYAKKNNALGARGLELILAEHERLFPSINILLKFNPSFPYDTSARYETKQESQDMQYKIFGEVTTFYSSYCKKGYVIKSMTAGDDQHMKDILKYLKEDLQ